MFFAQLLICCYYFIIVIILFLFFYFLSFPFYIFQMNFDALSKIHINSTDVGNYSVDRILNNNNNNNDNCSDNNDSDIVSTYRKAIDCSQLNYNADSLQLKNTNQHVDLAQMEYNVKQFLLKQNEWSPKESCPTTLTQSSISSVSASHSYC